MEIFRYHEANRNQQIKSESDLSTEQRALNLYREAEMLEAYGKRMEATTLYRRVLDLPNQSRALIDLR
jgi:hypothetical protein